jgi:hypothetical protein
MPENKEDSRILTPTLKINPRWVKKLLKAEWAAQRKLTTINYFLLRQAECSSVLRNSDKVMLRSYAREVDLLATPPFLFKQKADAEAAKAVDEGSDSRVIGGPAENFRDLSGQGGGVFGENLTQFRRLSGLHDSPEKEAHAIGVEHERLEESKSFPNIRRGSVVAVLMRRL